MTSRLYSSLQRAQLSVEYLHTNSTTHEFLFGALAELVDNSRDAGASRINIYTEDCASVRGEKILCFLDDGEGMSPEQSAKVIQFGYSGKRSRDAQSIGQYGNGLKSGAMRIGRDFILFTKRGTTMSCVFLSRSFHESEKIQEVIVPIPSWSQATKMPLGSTQQETEKHKIEVNLIQRFSPFKTMEDIMGQFDKIVGNGTLVMIYNLRLGDSGQTELDFSTKFDDILMDSRDPLYSETEASMKPERRSFRAYSSILYFDPKMKIYIQNVKVRTKRLQDQVYNGRLYHYTTKRFKRRMDNEVKKAKELAKMAEEAAREAESTARDTESRQGTSREGRVSVRNAQAQAARASEEAKDRKAIAEAMEKSTHQPKTLDMVFGLNIGNRSQDGIFVYNCSRLIKMYEYVGGQALGARDMNGIIGLVNVPYLVLEPTHNKQDFADAKEYRLLLKALADHLAQFWRDCGFDMKPVKARETWEHFGYDSPAVLSPHPDERFKRRRNMKLPDWMQCDVCGKWREIPYNVKEPTRDIPSNWTCSMNMGDGIKKCADPEQKRNFQIGQLQRVQTAPAPATSGAATASAATSDRDADRRRNRAEEAPAEENRQRKRKQEEVETSVHVPAAKRATPTNNAKSVPVESKSIAPSIVPQRKAAMDASAKLRMEPQVSSKSSSAKDIVPDTQESPAQHSISDDSDEDEGPMIIRRSAPARISRPSVNRPLIKSAPVSRTSSSGAGRGSQDTAPDDAAVSGRLANLQDAPGLTSDKYPLESRVEAKVNEHWYAGRVTKYRLDKENGCLRVRVKFDQNPHDKFDKHFPVNSENLRLKSSSSPTQSRTKQDNGGAAVHKPAQNTEVGNTRDSRATSSIATATAAAGTQQAPPPLVAAGGGTASATSTARSAAETAAAEAMNTEVANKFRTSLQYFLPPTWDMKKEEIGELSTSQLAEFPITEFFDQYEAYLNKLVESFKAESANQKQASENKLVSLRQNVAKLLRSIRETGQSEGEEADDTSDTVDKLLEAVVNASVNL
ncbi:ATPase MORC2A-like isoform X2 [Sycon ciliatum]|uniref:ATPase MORC2A-like isoform X2 n=1 Tax=Sycon ciliatum TaxID=27933 RepID=UPI0031F68BF1